MTNKEKLKHLLKTYEVEINRNDFSDFAPEVLRHCGSFALKKLEEILGSMESYYRGRYVIIDDVVFSADKKRLVRYSPEKAEESYVIPTLLKPSATVLSKMANISSK